YPNGLVGSLTTSAGVPVCSVSVSLTIVRRYPDAVWSGPDSITIHRDETGDRFLSLFSADFGTAPAALDYYWDSPEAGFLPGPHLICARFTSVDSVHYVPVQSCRGVAVNLASSAPGSSVGSEPTVEAELETEFANLHGHNGSAIDPIHNLLYASNQFDGNVAII